MPREVSDLNTKFTPTATSDELRGYWSLRPLSSPTLPPEKPLAQQWLEFGAKATAMMVPISRCGLGFGGIGTSRRI